MKLIRFGAPGGELPGVELDDGTRLDLSRHVPDYTPDFFASGGLAHLRTLMAHPPRLPPVPAGTRLGPPVARPHKFLAIGLNYRKHAEEAGHAIPTEPVIFQKATSCLAGPHDDIGIPPGSSKLDYELELAFVVKDVVRNLAGEQEAAHHFAGFTVCNDVSERHFQTERGGGTTKGKSFDSFGPLGPCLVTADAMTDYQGLSLRTTVNGETRQDSNTHDMIFTVPHLLWYLSQFMTLEPGDVVTTGTPEGVGFGMKPPRLLQEGDVLEMTVGGIGSLHQRVVRPA